VFFQLRKIKRENRTGKIYKRVKLSNYLMVYFSEILGKGIFDINKNRIGVVKDLCFTDAQKYAQVLGIIIDNKMLPWRFVAGIGDNEADELPFSVYLNKEQKAIKFSEQKGTLVSQVLDKQIIDISGARIVRVNDILLGKLNNKFVIIGVSVSFHSILRRLGLPFIKLNQNNDHIILWKDVAPLSDNIGTLQVRQQSEKLNEMHPAEIADLIRDLNLEEKLMVFNNLSKEKAAKTLLSAQPEVRESVFKTLSLKRIVCLLELMPVHESASILSLMPSIYAEKVFKVMKPGISAKIQKMLKYDRKTAGAFMSTRFISLPYESTVNSATEIIRKIMPMQKHSGYLYLINKDEILKGVVSLRDILLAKKETRVSKIMKKDIITVKPSTNINDIFNLMSKYELSILPVVDNNNKMLGVIRMHDLFDTLIPHRIRRERILRLKNI